MKFSIRPCLVVTVLLVQVVPLTVVKGEDGAFTNIAAHSTLPQGLGLAARFKADSGITAHSTVIFADDFESGELGARWDEQSPAAAQHSRPAKR